jgi:hypothetical protein
MKYQVMFKAIPIQCETASQAVALAVALSTEMTSTQRVRSHAAPQSSDETAVFDAVGALGNGCRRFTKALIENPDGLSADRLAEDLGYKKAADMEGVISAMKNSLKRRGVGFAAVFEETNQGERRFRIWPAVFGQVKRTLEIQ